MGLNPVDNIRPDPDADTEVPDEAPGVAAVVVVVSVTATESSGVACPLDIVLSRFSFLCSLSRFCV